MARILDRLPISTHDDLAFVGQEQVRVRAYEIIVWVSLQAERILEPGRRVPRFSAILDTGHTHNLSIQEEHLRRWAGLDPETLRPLGAIRQQGRQVPLLAADVWLHRNVPGHRDRLLDWPPLRLELQRGIAVYPPGAGFPRLPLLGLRALVTNRLRLVVAGGLGQVDLRSADWRSWLSRWLP